MTERRGNWSRSYWLSSILTAKFYSLMTYSLTLPRVPLFLDVAWPLWGNVWLTLMRLFCSWSDMLICVTVSTNAEAVSIQLQWLASSVKCALFNVMWNTNFVLGSEAVVAVASIGCAVGDGSVMPVVPVVFPFYLFCSDEVKITVVWWCMWWPTEYLFWSSTIVLVR